MSVRQTLTYEAVHFEDIIGKMSKQCHACQKLIVLNVYSNGF